MGRKRAALVFAGLALVAAAVPIVVVTARDRPLPHPGTQRATFRSADGRIEAAVYSVTKFPQFGPVSEVVLRPAGATANADMVSLGCTTDDDGMETVDVTVLPDRVVTRNYNGEERTIRFDPRTLQPESTLGTC